jgi:hypothetical protein
LIVLGSTFKIVNTFESSVARSALKDLAELRAALGPTNPEKFAKFEFQSEMRNYWNGLIEVVRI